MDPSFDNSLTKALLDDRRSDRRWRNIRFIGWMIIFIVYAILIFAPSSEGGHKNGPYVSLVRLSGIIMPGTSFSAEHVNPQLQKAFADNNSKGVVLVINSPGGSPVQASIIHDKILELKDRYHKKVVVVGEDALASGAYLVATAADKIFVSKDTLTGSIGVIMSGFGFVDTLNKLGMSRRLYTAGDNKARLDPFEPLKPEDVTKVQNMLNEVHQDFIGYVVQGRGDRLHGDRKELFSGDFWTGSDAVKLGLADATQNLWEVLKNEFDVRYYRDYTAKSSLLQNFFRDADTELNLHLMNNTAPVRAQAYQNMSTYVIGDVQGCYQELQQLLQLIEFNPQKDRLGFVGDLVNRGPNSLEVLRFVKSLPNPMVVLGNHDLYLLILGYELMPADSYEHTLHPIFEAPDKTELLDWLRHQPLIDTDASTQSLLVHAGLPPQWSVAQSITHAKEVAAVLQGNHFRDFLRDLFGDEPCAWQETLTGQNRWRYITNAFTRMRFCDKTGVLDLKANGNVSTNPHQFHPWFDFRQHKIDKINILFGHWAALNGHCDAAGCYALDTGCAWGYSLTAIRLEDKKRFSTPCLSSLRM